MRNVTSIVMRYSSEWRKAITRVGRWMGFDNDYKTLDPTFMRKFGFLSNF